MFCTLKTKILKRINTREIFGKIAKKVNLKEMIAID
jgi:hypothetical protein